VERKGGISVFAPKWGWDNVPLLAQLEEKIEQPIIIDNGAKAMGLAEMWFGVTSDTQHLVALLLGTGVGAAIISDGILQRGIANSAGEFGHITLNLNGRACRCGGQGCVETYVGALGIIQTLREMAPILETLRHLVGADASYLHVISGKRVPVADHSGNGLAEMRAAMDAHGVEWRAVVAGNLDPTEVVVRHRPDGSESHAPLGIRLAQVLHHGTDHRSQVCTALTNLGVEPPEIDVWDFGWLDGRVFEVEPD
jgi:predicted NBD/HSP70 family sugar kinase